MGPKLLLRPLPITATVVSWYISHRPIFSWSVLAKTLLSASCIIPLTYTPVLLCWFFICCRKYMCFLTQTKPFAVYLSSSYKEPSPITTLTCAFALAVRLALVHSVWWTHGAIFHSSHLQNLSQGSCPQYSVLWCHQLESGQCPCEVSDTLLLLSHVTACLVTFYHLLYIQPDIGLFWNSYRHTWSVTAAFKVCCDTVSTYIIWWQIPLAHEGSDMEVTTKIRSESFNSRWTQKTAVSSFEEESLQTFISSSWTNSYIACSYGPVLLHHFAHLVVTVSGEGCSSNKTRPWIGDHGWDHGQEFIYLWRTR